MKQALGHYDWALFDQNGFTHVLKRRQTEDSTTKTHVFLENSYYINGYWKDLPMDKMDTLKPFIKHFMGCQFCSGINRNEAHLCKKDFELSMVWSNKKILEAYSLHDAHLNI